jgi:lysylphosphatidylglycerol synthetase-like protein (DUF2156 family)
MDVLWTIVVAFVLVGVALLFIVDALQQRTVMARIAALLVLVGGVLAGAELGTPWAPLAVLVLAFCLGVAGRLGTEDDDGARRV